MTHNMPLCLRFSMWNLSQCGYSNLLIFITQLLVQWVHVRLTALDFLYRSYWYTVGSGGPKMWQSRTKWVGCHLISFLEICKKGWGGRFWEFTWFGKLNIYSVRICKISTSKYKIKAFWMSIVLPTHEKLVRRHVCLWHDICCWWRH